MDDLISRQAAIKATWQDTGYTDPFNVMTAIRDRIKQLPTIQPEPHWIPVDRELPQKSGEYLVTVKWVTGDCDVDVYEYDARHKTWNDGESAGGERAVAWCVLPEPYKGVTT